MSLLMTTKGRLRETLEDPDPLGADDFIEIFDNMADFEKALGIDGEVNSNNIQSIGTENKEPDTWSHHMQVNGYWSLLDSSFSETGSALAAPSRASSAYRYHSCQLTSLAAENETYFSSSDISRALSRGYSNCEVERKPLPKISLSDKLMHQSFFTNDDHTINYEQDIQYEAAQMERKRKRVQYLQTMINKRRQQFQQQKRADAEYVTQQLSRFQEQTRVNEKQRADEQAWKKQTDSASSEALGLALSDTITAATAIGIPPLDSSYVNSPRHEESQLNFQGPPPSDISGEASNTNDLDPEDPDPWEEEMEHYLLMGRIKRLEGLHAKEEAETTGKEYTATLYNPTGIRRHEFNPLLSRHGAGLSVAGATQHAVLSNARIRPSGHQGSSLVLQGQYNIHPSPPHDNNKHQQQQQQSSKRQRISKTLGSNENDDDVDFLDLMDRGTTTIGRAIPNHMNLSSSYLCRTREKTSVLMISNLCADVNETALKTLAPNDLKCLHFNRSDNTAILYFMTIDSAVMFRRLYDRSLVDGQHILIDFIKN
ncbi:hypothetical protein BCR42DRAFT_464243 [Absidia repens]|uniref:Uncharacterized protein n=1 Tax=Absidia repens TaxID=90262 RepID=A0A1X2J1A2_9FUNG|nr:hypothetical protein BCR42DRAFT_464243 [Absidia repens]